MQRVPMRIFKFFFSATKLVLAIGGVVFIVNKMNESNTKDQYRFEVDSLYGNESVNLKSKTKSSEKSNIHDLFHSFMEQEA